MKTNVHPGRGEAGRVLDKAMAIAREQIERVTAARPSVGSPVDLPDDIVEAMGVARATIDREGTIRIVAKGYAKSLTIDVTFTP